MCEKQTTTPWHLFLQMVSCAKLIKFTLPWILSFWNAILRPKSYAVTEQQSSCLCSFHMRNIDDILTSFLQRTVKMFKALRRLIFSIILLDWGPHNFSFTVEQRKGPSKLFCFKKKCWESWDILAFINALLDICVQEGMGLNDHFQSILQSVWKITEMDICLLALDCKNDRERC